MNKIAVCCLFFLSLASAAFSQSSFPNTGIKDEREGLYALTRATIFVDYRTKIDSATLLIRDGKILDVGSNVTIPKDAIVLDMKGDYIYPSFIELYADYGLPATNLERASNQRGPQVWSLKKGAYGWNQALQPEFLAAEAFSPDEKEADAYRKCGFGSVLTHRMDGISRGGSSLVSLGNENPHSLILKPLVGHHLSFNRGSSQQNYPRSLMGAIALLRQTELDAEWYAQQGHLEEINHSLEAWNNLKELPQVFEVRDWAEALRAAKIGSEFNMKMVFMGAGDEYQRVEEIAKLNAPFILPLNFPEAFDVSDPYDADLLPIEDLKHWELAPQNPNILSKANIPVALSSYKLEKKTTFLSQVRTAIEHGLEESLALKALTETPAKITGADAILGSLEKGKLANFLVCSGPVFDKETRIFQNWIQGVPYVLTSPDQHDLSGTYELTTADTTLILEVSGEPQKPDAKLIVNDSTSKKVKIKVNQNLISLNFEGTDNNPFRLSGVIHADGHWTGNADLGNGNLLAWEARPIDNTPEERSREEASDKENQHINNDGSKELSNGTVIYPFRAFGNTSLPQPENWLIKNVTVWTCEREGTLENTDVLVKNGKIAAIGKDINVDFAQVIDGSGKHLTPGIIDEHSHIAISRGVNEGSQYSSAEVSIADVVNSEDINIYRQLSGGVTTSQLLHGSANPIGGQSGIIKLKWGYTPEEMKINDAAPFIKFALGENVKQSNWGDDNRTRYPQTRMGVEQTYDDHFTRAREYGNLKASGKPYRKDLEMEALLEILEGKRFITCHSYQQGEINMLMKIAEKHGFRVNTFTHILEGYKVADKLAAHGAGASSFSDWWAYKYEVIDAIPYNGALMHEQGIVTAFNSDDAEMARRLNQEAAKAVMYGDMTEEEALKLVTLNPAKLLHIDHRTGSIKTGKDADLVLWSDHPLSVYAKAEKTFIEGIQFFDREEDLQKREWMRTERARLIKKMLSEKQTGGKTRAPGARYHHLYHCDDLHDEIGNNAETGHSHSHDE